VRVVEGPVLLGSTKFRLVDEKTSTSPIALVGVLLRCVGGWMAAPGGAKADGSWRRAAGSRDAPDEEKQTKTNQNETKRNESKEHYCYKQEGNV
jgi:hypothetical protein